MRYRLTALCTPLIAAVAMLLPMSASAQTVTAKGTVAEPFMQGIGFASWLEPAKALGNCECSTYNGFAEAESFHRFEITKGLLVGTFNLSIPTNATIENVRVRFQTRHYPEGVFRDEFMVSLATGKVRAMRYWYDEPALNVVVEEASSPWMESGWEYKPTASELDAYYFAVMIQGDNITGPEYATFGVNDVTLEVTYSVPAGPARAAKAAR